MVVLGVLVGITAPSAAAGAPPATIVAPVSAPSRIEADFDGAAFAVGAAGIRTWIERSAAIVSAYYARFPVPMLRLRVVAVDGSGVRNGKAYPGRGLGIEVRGPRHECGGAAQRLGAGPRDDASGAAGTR